MPLFDIECNECKNVWEFLQIRSDDLPICPQCKTMNVKKIFSSAFGVRMDSDSVLKSLPDPSPPLEELRGKQRPGTVGGFEDKPYADTQLKNYTRRRDRQGNIIWEEKRRKYFDYGGKE